jgi:lysophospholipase L1-like esterase
MSAIRLLFTLLFLTSLGLPAVAGTRTREGTEWDTAYWYNANDDKLPRVLLLGDSICNGYQSLVRDELAGVAYVSFWATSKCTVDRSYLKQLSYILEEYDYSVIHFNNGLHSLSTDRKDWEQGLRQALQLLKAKGKGAKIIWATSTPLKDPALTEKSKELNAIAARVMQEENVPTNDLFALMDPLDRNKFWTDTYHYSSEGRKMQASQVAGQLRAALGAHQATAAEAKAALKAAASETGPNGKIQTQK